MLFLLLFSKTNKKTRKYVFFAYFYSFSIGWSDMWVRANCVYMLILYFSLVAHSFYQFLLQLWDQRVAFFPVPVSRVCYFTKTEFISRLFFVFYRKQSKVRHNRKQFFRWAFYINNVCLFAVVVVVVLFFSFKKASVVRLLRFPFWH